jgi:hypothetical protein
MTLVIDNHRDGTSEVIEDVAGYMRSLSDAELLHFVRSDVDEAVAEWVRRQDRADEGNRHA